MKTQAFARKLQPNGKLPIRMGWAGGFQQFDIVGGPFDYFDEFSDSRSNSFGVCVRAEHAPTNLDLHLPIADFDVPRNDALTRETVRRTIAAALDGKDIYVGCQGGWGRTGLFLALIAKATGEDDPVGYVRKHYSPRAVETPAQRAYVENFDVTSLQSDLFWRSWTKRWADAIFWWR